MVSLSDVQSSNSRIASVLPPGLVAVFVGATNGIGETSLKQFAKHARKPRIYFVGRSEEAGNRIAGECKALNSEGEYLFVKSDVSLIKNVDDVCSDIKTKEKAVNLLFLTQGTMIAGAQTSEGLHYAAALAVHSRSRFIVNLLPLLQNATALRRVVTVFTATKEGPIDMDNFQGLKLPLMALRGHASSIVTLSLEELAKKAPDVSFIHNFPGTVKSGITRGTTGGFMLVAKALIRIIGPWVYLPLVEVGDRHVFLSTSAKYPPRTSGDTVSGVPLSGVVAIARGTDGKYGSGVYSVDWEGESAGPKVEEVLAGLRKEGMGEKVWKQTEDDFKRITGVESI